MSGPIVQIVAALVLLVAALAAFLVVHQGLERLCLWHAHRHCQRQGLTPRRFRCQPARDDAGIKTEATLVELDCSDVQGEGKIVRLLVWPLGVRQVLDSDIPTSDPSLP